MLMTNKEEKLNRIKSSLAIARSNIKSIRSRGVDVYPPHDQVLNAFSKTPFESVKVVIVGQDPYHGENQANGYSFSVAKGNVVPPSLANIFKELNDDVGSPIPDHGCLEKWAEQGVLLLNRVLTVESGKANSHVNLGWEDFTQEVIQYINDFSEGVVFMLWGKEARKLSKNLNKNKHLILEAAHPSPLSARRGFFGCKHFSKANEFLKIVNKTPIKWEDI